MPYLNLDVNYFEHRKTIRLESILGQGAALYPLRLWTYCAKHHAFDGVLRGYTGSEIEKLLGWTGARGVLIRALIKTNFVEKCSEPVQDGSDLSKSVQICSNLFKIHSWESHEGHIKNFQIRAKTAAARRWGKILEPSLADATSIAKHSLEHAPTNPNQAVPNITKPISTTSGEEGSAAPVGKSTAVELELALVGYKKPDPKLEPERALACEYREIRKIPKAAWASWDKENLEEFKTKARALLDLCGSLKRATACLYAKAADFEAKKFTNWTINGVVKNADQWIASHPEESHVRTHDRKSIPVSPIGQPGARTSQGLRGPSSAAEILAGVRGMPNVPAPSGPKNGAGDRSHESSGGGVLKNPVEAKGPDVSRGKPESNGAGDH